jgi:2-amino-4-hydroxy-6-hydroxymethyldihydropteridine diphosphokinase
MMHTVFLGLGTNVGDRAANLEAARLALEPGVHIQEASSIYETTPWGYIDQPDFLNQVLIGETSLEPADLLVFIKKLEREVGRRPTFRNGPRIIDVDILFIDDLVLSLPGLELPHPRIEERAFVLVPLAELAPGLLHPTLRRSISELLKETEPSGVRRLYPASLDRPCNINGS